MENSGESRRSPGIKIYKIKFSRSLDACTEGEKFRKLAGSFALVQGSITQSSILTLYCMERSEGKDYSCSLNVFQAYLAHAWKKL